MSGQEYSDVAKARFARRIGAAAGALKEFYFNDDLEDLIDILTDEVEQWGRAKGIKLNLPKGVKAGVIRALRKSTEMAKSLVEPFNDIFQKHIALETDIGNCIFYAFYGLDRSFAQYDESELRWIRPKTTYMLSKISLISKKEAVSYSKLTINAVPSKPGYLWLYRQEKEFSRSGGDQAHRLLAKGFIQRSGNIGQLLFIGQQLLINEDNNIYANSDQLMYFDTPVSTAAGISKIQGIELRVYDDKPTAQLVVMERKAESEIKTGIVPITSKKERPSYLKRQGEWSNVIADTDRLEDF